MQIDIASQTKGYQPGLVTSVSPDRGDGSRMSYLRFDSQTDGIHVYFDDVSDPGPLGTVADFNEDDVATLSYTAPHTIKLTLATPDGPGNDVVKVYVDGQLVKTGTSWEDYYRYDPEASAEQSPRIVRTALFREGGTAVQANQGKGFLFDNLTLTSGPIVNTPTTKNDCKDGDYKDFTDDKGNTFKNQGQCVSFVESNKPSKNNTNIKVNNSNNQSASSGNAKVKGNTTGGSATSGGASNSNSNTFTFTVSNNPTF
jgi:hypothetical protein